MDDVFSGNDPTAPHAAMSIAIHLLDGKSDQLLAKAMDRVSWEREQSGIGQFTSRYLMEHVGELLERLKRSKRTRSWLRG